MDEKYNQAIQHLCSKLYSTLKKVPDEIQSSVKEVCIRCEKPIIIMCEKRHFFLKKDGSLTQNINLPLRVISKEEIQDSVRSICNDSIYSYNDEIKNGFLTIKGGHRIGICGTAVLDDNMKITTIRDVSTLNVRIARQIKSSADEILSRVNYRFKGLIIAGVPASGKTTVLREIARKLSLLGKKVSVIDERNEFSGTYMGIAQNDLGFSDILNGYPKSCGLMMAIRTLSPDVIVCDEVGSVDDVEAILYAVNSGVSLVVSVHAGGVDDFYKRRQCLELLKTNAFDTLIVMSGKNNPGEVCGVFKVEDNIDKSYRSNFVDKFIDPNRIYEGAKISS